MPPHHDGDNRPAQRPAVAVQADKRLRNVPRRRRIAGTMVVAHQIVVYGLRNVNTAQFIIRFFRFFADDADGIGRIVAADIKENI